VKLGKRIVVFSGAGETATYLTVLNFTLPIPAALPSHTSLPSLSKGAEPVIAREVPAHKVVEKTMENFVLECAHV